MFDRENEIALHAMQGNRASSRGEGEFSWVFSSCGRKLGYIFELQRGCPFESLVCSLKSGTCLGKRDNSGMSTRRGRNPEGWGGRGQGVSRGRGHICLWLIRVDVWQKSSAMFKAIILQLKTNKL